MNFDTILNYFIIICGVISILYLIVFYYLYKGINRLKLHLINDQPVVSIVVCMHNEEENAEILLDCLLNQNYLEDKLEIIIVNDRSEDATQKILEQKQQSSSLIKIITINDLTKNFAPKKRAIDTAVRQSKGEIILLTDADGRPGINWVSNMVSLFSAKIGMVIGYAPYTVNNTRDKLLALEYFSHAAIAAATAGLEFPLTCVGTNIAYRKEVFIELDGFGPYKHIHTGDDDLFLQRVRDESNWRIRYSTLQNTHVFNAPPDSWKKFYNQRLRYASKGFKYPTKVTFSLIGYYLFNLFLLLAGVMSLFAGTFSTGFICLILLKGIAEILFLKKAGKVLSETRLFHFFPIVFFLHILYVVYFGLMGNLRKFEWSGVKQ